jgi:hypothetical protein
MSIDRPRPWLLISAVVLSVGCLGAFAWMDMASTPPLSSPVPSSVSSPVSLPAPAPVAAARPMQHFLPHSPRVWPHVQPDLRPPPEGPVTVWEATQRGGHVTLLQDSLGRSYPIIIAGIEWVPGHVGILHVCRGRGDDGTMRVGKIVDGDCHMALNGREVVLLEYDILRGFGQWAEGDRPGALTVDGKTDAYVCRTPFLPPEFSPSDHLHIGVQPGTLTAENMCRFSYAGKEHVSSIYDLFYPAH